MSKLIVLAILLSSLILAPVPGAWAYTIGFTPSGSFTAVNTTSYSFDIIVSGLTTGNQIVSAYSLDILYNPLILQYSSAVYGLGLGTYNSDFMLTDVFQGTILSSGRVNMAAVSLLSDADLLTLQHSLSGSPDSVKLGTLNFAAIGDGPVNLAFDWFPSSGGLRDVKGLGANIIIDGHPVVPEPATVLLFGSGLCALWGLGQRKRVRRESSRMSDDSSGV